eukprot:UN00440
MQQTYSFEVDFWSLGTLLYEMIVGIPPFYNNNVNIMYQRILQAPLQFPPGVMSEHAEDFIAMLLERNPQRRAQNCQHIKSHPWFQLFGLDFDAVYRKIIIPPFRPNAEGNIDEEFLQESIAETPTGPGILGGKTRVKFPQFSYQEPSGDDNANSNFTHHDDDMYRQ